MIIRIDVVSGVRLNNLGIQGFRNWGLDMKQAEYIQFLNP
jgi:hypothetical protein